MFNVRLKTKLIERNVSQNELAHQLCIKELYLLNIMRGWCKPPDGIKLEIAELLDADVNWLFDKEDVHESE